MLLFLLTDPKQTVTESPAVDGNFFKPYVYVEYRYTYIQKYINDLLVASATSRR